MLPCLGAVVPVSYTHLDVYKRQGQGFGACFRVPVFHGEEVDLSPGVHGNGGVEFRAGQMCIRDRVNYVQSL